MYFRDKVHYTNSTTQNCNIIAYSLQVSFHPLFFFGKYAFIAWNSGFCGLPMKVSDLRLLGQHVFFHELCREITRGLDYNCVHWNFSAFHRTGLRRTTVGAALLTLCHQVCWHIITLVWGSVLAGNQLSDDKYTTAVSSMFSPEKDIVELPSKAVSKSWQLHLESILQ